MAVSIPVPMPVDRVGRGGWKEGSCAQVILSLGILRGFNLWVYECSVLVLVSTEFLPSVTNDFWD